MPASVVDPYPDLDSMGSLDPYPDPGGQKWTRKIEILRAEGFSCGLDVLYGGLGISKLQFLIKKRYKKMSACIFLHF